MSTMILEVYDALKSAGAPEEKAQAAATVLAETAVTKADLGALATKADTTEIRTDLAVAKAETTEIRTALAAVKAETTAIRTDLAAVKVEMTEFRTDLAVAKAELALVKWLVSGIGFGVLLLVIKSFWPGH